MKTKQSMMKPSRKSSNNCQSSAWHWTKRNVSLTSHKCNTSAWFSLDEACSPIHRKSNLSSRCNHCHEVQSPEPHRHGELQFAFYSTLLNSDGTPTTPHAQWHWVCLGWRTVKCIWGHQTAPNWQSSNVLLWHQQAHWAGCRRLTRWSWCDTCSTCWQR